MGCQYYSYKNEKKPAGEESLIEGGLDTIKYNKNTTIAVIILGVLFQILTL